MELTEAYLEKHPRIPYIKPGAGTQITEEAFIRTEDIVHSGLVGAGGPSASSAYNGSISEWLEENAGIEFTPVTPVQSRIDMIETTQQVRWNQVTIQIERLDFAPFCVNLPTNTVPGSEIVILNGSMLVRGIDYDIQGANGLTIVFLNEVIEGDYGMVRYQEYDF